jgi:hypothetical protein
MGSCSGYVVGVAAAAASIKGTMFLEACVDGRLRGHDEKGSGSLALMIAFRKAGIEKIAAASRGCSDIIEFFQSRSKLATGKTEISDTGG